ncbi:L-methionine/branched-chain amino acid transporter [Motilimonas pumila]|nr:L-methionine/branched-chain amino acid transporter [Motilimonas pumila]
MAQPSGKINVWQGASLLLSTLLGSGLLIIPALAASAAGNYSLLAWALIIAAMMPIVVTFSALGKRFPHQAGTAYYVQQAFGQRAAKAIGVLYVSIAPIGPPVVFITGAGYACQLFDINLSASSYIEITLLVLVFIANCLRFTTSAFIQCSISVVLISVVVAICLWSLPNAPAITDNRAPSLSMIGAAMVIMFWCFVGIEAICHVANHFAQPSRDFPRAVVLGVAIAAAIYMLLSYCVLRYQVYGSAQQNLLSVTLLAQHSIGPLGQKLVALMGLLGCLCAVNLYVISFTNMLASFGENTSQTWLNTRLANGSAIYALILVVLSIAMTLLARAYFQWSFDDFLQFANAQFVLIYCAAAAAGSMLLKGRSRMAALFSLLFCTAMLYFVGASGWYCLLFLGLVWGGLFLCHKKERARSFKADSRFS